MDDPFEVACRALQIWTVCHRLVLILDEWRLTNGTTLREMINFLFPCAPLDNGFHDLWYDFTCSFDKHPIADTQVFALNVAFVVKRSTRDGYSANIDRF